MGLILPLTIFAIGSVGYILVAAAYRLFWSPIRHFPGPKLAALTFWYEGWYDIIKDGRYTWKIKELHQKYGPVIRINPCELHVNDPEFYHVLYTGSTRRTDKWGWSARMFGTNQAIVGTTDHSLHHMRKHSLQPFFSKSSVSRLEPLIQQKVNLLCHVIQGFRDAENKVVNLSDAFTAFSADVIGSYVFGVEYRFLERTDFAPEWRRIMTDLSRSTHLMKQFGWVYPILNSRMGLLLGRLAALAYNPLEDLFIIRDSTSEAIEKAKQEPQGEQAKTSINARISHLESVMESLLRANGNKMPAAELETSRLTDEGITLLGAGTVTTAQTLSITLYFVLSSPNYCTRLTQELADLYAIHSSPTWSQLSQLPFLTAVIHEGLRLSYGVSSRLPRIAPDDDLPLPDGRTIPRKTPISMTHMFLHDDPTLFASPLQFIPERWLDMGSRKLDEQPLLTKKYFVPFSRGTRSCLGTNLAWAELYMAIAGLLRPREFGGVELDLYDTAEDEVRVRHDYFNPAPRIGALGVRVLVK